MASSNYYKVGCLGLLSRERINQIKFAYINSISKCLEVEFDSTRLQWFESREECEEALIQLSEKRPDLFCITKSLDAVFRKSFLRTVIHCYNKPCKIALVTKTTSYFLEVDGVEKLHNEVVDLMDEDMSNLLGYVYTDKTGELLTFRRDRTAQDTVCKSQAISKMTHLEEYKGCVSFVLKDDSLKWFCLQKQYILDLESVNICARDHAIYVVLESKSHTFQIPFYSFQTVCRFLEKADLKVK